MFRPKRLALAVTFHTAVLVIQGFIRYPKISRGVSQQHEREKEDKNSTKNPKKVSEDIMEKSK